MEKFYTLKSIDTVAQQDFEAGTVPDLQDSRILLWIHLRPEAQYS